MNHEVPDNGSFKRVFIANRGEIAIRIAKAATMLGMESVGVHVPMDASSLHTRYTTENREIGSSAGDQADPVNAYLDIDALVNAAKATGCDCVHPGYGFLSENAAFADAVIAAGMTWIGPPSAAIAAMGDKLAAKRTMVGAALPTLPSVEITDSVDLSTAGNEIGFPLLVKASAGGGGKGMRVVEGADGFNAITRRKLGSNTEQLVEPETIAEKNEHVPSHYFRENFSWTIETEEPALADGVAYLGAKRFLFATDYPHDDPGGSMKFRDVELLAADDRFTEDQKEQMRWRNAAALFGVAI